jgi:hypothetical protein
MSERLAGMIEQQQQYIAPTTRLWTMADTLSTRLLVLDRTFPSTCRDLPAPYCPAEAQPAFLVLHCRRRLQLYIQHRHQYFHQEPYKQYWGASIKLKCSSRKNNTGSATVVQPHPKPVTAPVIEMCYM